jgi:hypothetical protein
MSSGAVITCFYIPPDVAFKKAKQVIKTFSSRNLLECYGNYFGVDEIETSEDFISEIRVGLKEIFELLEKGSALELDGNDSCSVFKLPPLDGLLVIFATSEEKDDGLQSSFQILNDIGAFRSAKISLLKEIPQKWLDNLYSVSN